MYYNKSVADTIQLLKTSEKGLSQTEAEKRLLENGKNELSEGKKKSVFMIFLSQFMDLLVIILIAAAITSFFTNNADSAVVIICVITMNAVIGTVQSVKAEKSLAALKAMSSPQSKVLRDGKAVTIPASDICTGDILLLEAGDIASADGRFIEVANVTSDESSLTGESVGVNKIVDIIDKENTPLADRKNMVFSGSKITNGRGVVVVTGTGMDTEIGKIAELLNSVKAKQTPLQKELNHFSKLLSFGILIICAVVMGLSLLRGTEILDAMMFAVALAVAAIPEALGSIVTISLAIGTRKMAAENAIIKDLKAVESLGCVNVICSDKTGTLTQNKMTVRETAGGNEDELKLSMCLCNDASFGENDMLGDPTETALISYCGEEFFDNAINNYPRLSELPFDSERKMMSTLHSINGKIVMVTKGAFDIMLNNLTKILENGKVRDFTDGDRENLIKCNNDFSEKGMRVLCFANRELSDKDKLGIQDESDFTFIGLSAMTDPPRPESKNAVADCITAGIKPVMITGDHKVTATAIAKEIGIYSNGDVSLDGTELDKIDDEKLTEMLPKVSVFARVNPSHKIRIVGLWQKLGSIVAMTGDGVNDAPALKEADVGVAMGITGTQVSKDAASVVLTDDNFATIVKAVANGRTIYRNIKNSVKFLLMGNFAAILSVLCCVIVGLPMPFSPVHLLFINLLTDSLPAIAISTEEADPDVLFKKPRKSGSGILDKAAATSVGLQGVLLAITTMVAYFIGYNADLASGLGNISLLISPTASTMAFASLCLGRLFAGFGCRSDKPLRKIGILSNKFSVVAFFAGVIFLGSALFIQPLHGILDVVGLVWYQYLIILGCAIAPLAITQIFKK